MENLKDKHIIQMYKDHVRQGLPVIKRGKISIIPNMREGAKKYFFLVLSNQKILATQIKHKICWGELGQFIFIDELEKHRTGDMFDFSTLRLYNTLTGKPVENVHHFYGKCNLGKIVILNNQIMAVCGEKHQSPLFYAVVNNQLHKVPATVMESALRFSRFREQHKIAFIEHFMQNEWELHNGIMINPQTLDVPTELHFQFWKRGRRYKADFFKPDMNLLTTILTRSDEEKSVIKYITL